MYKSKDGTETESAEILALTETLVRSQPYGKNNECQETDKHKLSKLYA